MKTSNIKLVLIKMGRFIVSAELTDARRKQMKSQLDKANEELLKIENNPQVELKMSMKDFEEFIKNK